MTKLYRGIRCTECEETVTGSLRDVDHGKVSCDCQKRHFAVVNRVDSWGGKMCADCSDGYHLERNLQTRTLLVACDCDRTHVRVGRLLPEVWA